MFGVFRHIKGCRSSFDKASKSVSPTLVERLEPRILLSGDSLLHAVSDPLSNPLERNTPEAVQYVDLFKTGDQIRVQTPAAEQQAAGGNPGSSRAINTENCQPILTISLDNKDIESSEIPAGAADAFGLEIAPGKNGIDEFLSRFDELPEAAKTSPKDFAFGQEISAQRPPSHDETLSLNDVGLVQSSDAVVEQSDATDQSAGNRVNPALAIEIPADETIVDSTVVTCDDDSMPTYVSDADLSIEFATSIEIRGPPADTANSSTTFDLSTYVISDEIAESSDVGGLYTLSAPELPGLVLVDPDISSWNGQIIYLDFGGAEDVIYNGPVTVGPFDVPAFQAPGNLAGQEQAIISEILSELEETFASTGIIFTIEQPSTGTEYSTIYIGDDDSAFKHYGSFLGLAEQVDAGNLNRSDDALVFTEEVAVASADSFAVRQAGIIAHEVGHLIGMAHVGPSIQSIQPLSRMGMGDVAALVEVEPNDTLLSATSLVLVEDPVGSGLWLSEHGLGSIQPAGDVDYWSFEALAGDVVSVSVDTPDSDLNPYVELRDAADGGLVGDSDAGPWYDAFLSHYVIPSSGTYYVWVYNLWDGGVGSYEVRVELAREIGLESDANYSNDSIAGANVLTLVQGAPGHLVGTIAGTTMGMEWSNLDEDLYLLGTLSAGNVVELDVRLPSNSSWNGILSVVDASGVAVTDEDGAVTDGHFLGTISADGTYYAKVQPLWSYNGHSYLLTDSSLTWSQAEAYAQALGGHLVTINDQAEQDWLTATFSQFGTLWIGLNDEVVEGTWVWSSGEAVTYTNWAGGEPNNWDSWWGGEGDFAWQWTEGTWSDFGTNASAWGLIELNGSGTGGTGSGPRAQYLLDVDVADLVAPQVTGVSPLPASGGSTDKIVDKLMVTVSEDLEASTVNAVNPAVRQYNGHYYLLTPTAMAWADAEAYAQGLDGHLVMINDAAEQAWITTSYAGVQDYVWIGLTDQATEGTWVWSSGEALGYTNWASGVPNGWIWENFAAIHSSGGWDDLPNGSTRRGLVELDSATDSDGDGVPDVLDVSPLDPLNMWDLREAGVDGVFDTADDVGYRLVMAPAYSSGLSIGLLIEDGPLGDGHYRFTANSTLTDRSGNALDGNGDGTGGDAYQHLFDVSLPAGMVFEGRSNNTLATATALSLQEDPVGSGLWLSEHGLGSIQPAGDVDYWSFEALAGDVVSVSVDTPDSDLNPYVELRDAADGGLVGDSDAGPWYDAFLSHYVIPSSGTYYVWVYNLWDGGVGSYEVRVELAREIGLESDANYSNDSIAGANTVQFDRSGARRAGTIAGTIMAPEWGNVDEDYFNLGVVDAGETILVSLRLPESSSLDRPVVEIRDSSGSLIEVVVEPIETAARAHISRRDIYFVSVVTLAGQGPRGQYVLDAAVWPTSELDFPDLFISEITAPSTASSGQTMTVAWRIENIGEGSTYTGSWYDRLVLSTNEGYGDSDDIELARIRFLGILGPHQEYTAQTEVRTPIGWSGTYHLFVHTDDGNRLFEYVNEGNNIAESTLPLVVTLTPYADLEVNSITVPAEIRGSDPATITWTVTNHGSGITNDGTPDGVVTQWTDNIVFSRNDVFGDADDRFVADVSHDNALLTGESYAGTWTGEVPGNLSGDYYVFVTTDWGNTVYEHDDSRSNTASSAQTTFVRQWVIQPGTLTEDTIWDGLIKVLGTVTIPSGKTLTVRPGSVIKFITGSLDVDGRLEVFGTADRPVVFTSIEDDTAKGDTNGDGDATSPGPGAWTGLVVRGTGQADLKDFQIRYATNAVNAGYQGARVVLTNGILRDSSQYGIYVYSPYVEVTVENCVIADNGLAGVYAWGANWADSRFVFRNSTIVGNGFGSGGYRGGINAAGADITLENCVVAFNSDGLRQDTWWPTQVTIRNSLFYNPVGGEIVGGDTTILQGSGNLISDPLFVDRSASNYELAAGSPAIDAGGGIKAPATDILGRSRFDDVGMPNVGTGYPAYVDIGAYERQTHTQSGDLAIAQVLSPAPEFVTVGENFSVQWTVANVGTGQCVGPWTDAVYLSRDRYLSTDDLLLETRTHSNDLTPGDRYTEALTATAPTEAGVYYVLARTNADGSAVEPVAWNNVLAAIGVLAVDLPVLTVGGSVSGTVTQGPWDYIRLETTPGNTVLLTFDAIAQSGAVGLYIRYGAPPTLDTYDVSAAAPYSPDQELRILSPRQGTYYVGVYSNYLPNGPTDYTLFAGLTGLAIRQVTPGTVGNAGNATVQIIGDNFHPDAQVQLVASGGGIIEGVEYYQDATALFATFDLAAAGAEPGLYDVVVVNPGPEIVTQVNVLTVVAGGKAEFQARISMPGLTRPGRVIDVRVDYTNPGLIDVAAPILTFRSDRSDCLWQVPGSEEWVTRSTLCLLGLSSTGPTTILRPGQTETLIVPMRVPFRPEPVTINLSSVGATPADGSNTPIDWPAVEDSVRPPTVDQSIWEETWTELTRQIGTYWGDYAAVLREDSTLLPREFGSAFAVEDVFQIAIHRAEAAAWRSVTGQVTDVGPGDQSVGGDLIHLVRDDGTLYASGWVLNDGTFVIPGVEVGTYTVMFDEHVLAPGEPHQLVVGEEGLHGVQIDVLPGAFVAGLVQPVGIAGVLSEVVVIARDSQGGVYPADVLSDSSYRLGPLPAGTYDIAASTDLFAPSQITGINVVAGQEIEDLDFYLERGASICGTVSLVAEGPVATTYDVEVTSPDGTAKSRQFDVGIPFALSGLAGGSYRVRIVAGGYAAAVVQPVDLVLGQTVDLSDISLEVGGAVAGIISDANSGEPLAGAGVIVRIGDDIAGISTTDRDGTYQVENLTSGSCTIEVLADGYWAAQQSIGIIAGATVDFSTELTTAGSIYGSVTNSVGVGLEGVPIHALSDTGELHSILTGADGHYQLTAIPAGSYTVSIGGVDMGYLDQTHVVLDESHPSQTVDFFLDVVGIVSGVVYESDGTTPIEGALVALGQDGDTITLAETDAAGFYKFIVLLEGTYTVEPCTLMEDFAARTVVVTVGSTLSDIDFVAGHLSIAGTVIDQDTGEPASNGTISVIATDPDTLFATAGYIEINPDGSFEVSGLTAGEFKVIASLPGHAPQAIQVTLSETGSPPLQFELQAGATLSGVVVDALTGEPIVGATVLLVLQGPDEGSIVATTDESGRYEVSDLSPGTYQITVMDGEHEAAQATVAATASNSTDQDFSLVESSTEIAGRVLNDGGVPIEGAQIIVVDGQGTPLGYATTGSDGSFVVEGLPSGAYHVQLAVPQHVTAQPTPITIEPGGSVMGIELVATRAAADPSMASSFGCAWTNFWDDFWGEFEAKCPECQGLWDKYMAQQRITNATDTKVDEAADAFNAVLGRTMVEIGAGILLSMAAAKLAAIAGAAAASAGMTLLGTFLLKAAISTIAAELKSLTMSVITRNPDVGKKVIQTASDKARDELIKLGSVILAEKTGGRDITSALWVNQCVGNFSKAMGKVIDVLKPILSHLDDLKEKWNAWRAAEKELAAAKKDLEKAHREYDACKPRCGKPGDICHPIPPPGGPGDSGTTNPQYPVDPEDKFGPAGYDASGTEFGSEQRFVQAGDWMDYRIEQWNHEDATVPAIDVIMEDTLDPSVFDLSTFEFTRIGFLKWDYALVGGQAIDLWVDCRPEMDLLVHVRGSFEPETGKIEWWLQSVDPITGDYPDDPMVGVLPPYDPETGSNIAWYEFRVKLRDDLPTGTVVPNRAYGEFDFMGDRYNNPAPKAGPWINTVDAGSPSSSVLALPAVSYTYPGILVQWAGQDDAGGSGIAGYDIYVSDDGAPFTIWLAGTSLTEAVFDTAQDGHAYAFYSVAIDGVGHREAAPEAADAQTLAVEPETAEVTRITVVNSPTATISIVFSESMALQPMIDDQSILLAVSLTSLSSGPIPLDADWFSYDDVTWTLSITLDDALLVGGYEVRLGGGMLVSSDGKVLRGGTAGAAFQVSTFSAGQIVQAGGVDLLVNEYSVPSLVDWDGDGRLDLVVGEKTAAGQGKVRIYLNEGSNTVPVFSNYSYAKTTSGDLAVPATGCMGVFPRVFDWNSDGLKDLVLGLADGRIQVWINLTGGGSPIFGAPAYVQFGPAGAKGNIDVGDRATLDMVDWNNDGRYDLVAGGLDGKIRLYVNEAIVGPADFSKETLLRLGLHDLVVPTGRASVTVGDLNGDGRKDLVVGNTEGQLFYYLNIGTDSAPVFDSAGLILADGIPVDLAGTARSRPSLADFNGDDTLDILLGSADGLVRWYMGHSQPPIVIPPGESTGRPGGVYLYTVIIESDSQPPVLMGWQLEADTGASPSDRLTNDTTPILTFVFSEPVFGASSDIQVTDSNSSSLVPDSVVGWGTDTVIVVFSTPLNIDGQYTATLKSTATITDQAGNPLNGGTDEVVSFYLDTTSPVVTVDPLLTNDPTPQLTGTVDDPDAVIEVTVAGNTYSATNNGDGTWTLADDTISPALSDGTYDVALSAADLAGNVSVDATTNELTVDTAAPVVTVGTLLTNEPTPQLTGMVDDPAAVVEVMVAGNTYSATNNGDGTWTLADGTISPVLVGGTYDVAVSATDLAGNVGSDATSSELTVDTTAPVVTVDTLLTNDSTPRLTGTVNDSDAVIGVTVAGNAYGAVNNGDGTWTLADGTITPALIDGTCDVAVSATDLAGNVGSDATTNELTVDTSAPVVTVDTLLTSDSTPRLTGTVDDPDAVVQVTVAGNTYSAVNNGDGTWTLADDMISPALAEGAYDVAASASDLAGNVGNDSTTNELTISLEAPVLENWVLSEDTGSDSTDKLTNDTTPVLTFTFSENVFGDGSDVIVVDPATGAVVPDSIGGWGSDTLVVTFSTPLVLDGEYTVTLKGTNTIRDDVGNPLNGGVDEVVFFTLDATAPAVTVSTLLTNDTTPQLTGTVNDPAAAIDVAVGGNTFSAANNGDGTWILADDTISPALADGIYDVAVSATDLAGNVGGDATSSELTVDTTAPAVTVDTLLTNDPTPELTGTVNDRAAAIEVAVGGNTYSAANNGDGTWILADDTISRALTEGTYDVVVSATDLAGNVGTDATVDELTVNINNAPVPGGDSATTDEDSAVDIDVLANDSDPDGDTLTIESLDTTGTTGLVTVNLDGTINYDPNGRFDYLAEGESTTDSFGYVISDGEGGTSSATVTVTITGTSDLIIESWGVRRGRTAGSDVIDVSGMFDVPLNSILGANEIEVRILAADGSEVYSEVISVNLTDLRRGVYTYRPPTGKGWPGGITLLKLDANKQQFVLKAKDVDLSALGESLNLEILVGDYFGSTQ